jgi:hypothetical protein
MSRKKTATEEALEQLHAQLATVMKARLSGPEVSAADLNVIRAFLKDNGIDAVPTKGSPLGDLVDKLPTFGPDDIAAEDQTYN